MKEHPILFSTPMVQAILAVSAPFSSICHRKTMTRRVIRNPESYSNIRECEFCCPYGVAGDRLWVRETWKRDTLAQHAGYIYKADCDEKKAKDYQGFWKPSIFMPRHASRINLQIEKIRVEQLQEISDGDAEKEAIKRNHSVHWPDGDPGYMDDVMRRNFAATWDTINGKKHPWKSNPWVWVIEFKRIT